VGLSRRSLQELWRVLLSVLGAGVLMSLASAALFVTSAPKWVSLLVEPFSLLLVPGVAFSMLFTKAHDYTQWEILRGAFGFHVVVLYFLLRWWDGQKGLAQR
jgi:hypothetical protein